MRISYLYIQCWIIISLIPKPKFSEILTNPNRFYISIITLPLAACLPLRCMPTLKFVRPRLLWPNSPQRPGQIYPCEPSYAGVKGILLAWLDRSSQPETLSRLHELLSIFWLTSVHHNTRNQPRNYFISDENRHNSAWITNDFVSSFLKTTSQIVIVFNYFLSAVCAFLSPQDVELGQRSGRLDRIDDSCVTVSTSHVLD